MTVRTVSAREANQRFSELLREVEGGQSFVVTKRGRPVATLRPVEATGARQLSPEQEAALRRIMATRWHLGGERLDRDALHER
jgi:prevent-host-death family protein